jgi:ribosome biogenesis GTPase
MHQGRIVKGIGGFYYVNTNFGLIECKPRGIFRKDGLSPLVGDRVTISLIRGTQTQGVIEEILPRESLLLRPSVANVEQCVIVSAIVSPKPDLLLLDRLLVLTEINGLETVICFNKMDLKPQGEYDEIINMYSRAGYIVLRTSTKTGEGIEALKEALRNKISVFAGMSGVGKSSLMNKLQPQLGLKTGTVSDKSKRGRHTTRHAQLIELEFGGMVVDTPGFSSLSLGAVKETSDMEESNLCHFYPEFRAYIEKCRFNGCRHLKEPGCSVKQAVNEGSIAVIRYENYVKLLEELQESRRRRYD